MQSDHFDRNLRIYFDNQSAVNCSRPCNPLFYRPTKLLTIKPQIKCSVVLSTVCIFSPTKLTSSALTRSSYIPFTYSFWCVWTSLIIYSKPTLKSNVNKRISVLQTFLNRKCSKCLSTQN